MRGVLVLLLVGALVPLAPGATSATVGTTACAGVGGADLVLCDDFSSAAAAAQWTSSASPAAPAFAWTKEAEGSAQGSGDDFAWYAGSIVAGPDGALFHGYYSNVVLTLTSPTFGTEGLAPTSLSFEVKGNAEGGIDKLALQVSNNGGAFITYDTVASEIGDNYVVRTSDLGAQLPGSFVVRFVFTADLSCDSFVTEPTGEACGGEAPGLWVDNVIVRGENPPAPPATSVPGAGNQLPRLANLAISTRTLDITTTGSQTTTSMNVTDDRGIVHAEAYFQKGFDLLKVPLARGTGNQWVGWLSGSETRLSAGTWDVTLTAYDSDGAINSTAFGTLAVTAANPGPAPTIALQGRDATKELSITSGDVLRLQVNSTLLRKVTYQLVTGDGSRGPVVELGDPYFLHSSALAEGPQQILVNVVDRLGRQANLTVRATLDTLAPLVDLAAPPVAYAGVPIQVQIVVKERSRHAAVVSAGGELTSLTGDGPVSHTVKVTPQAAGFLPVSVTVQDAVGHSTTASTVVEVRNLITDGAVDSVRGLANDLVSGAVAQVEVKVKQNGGLIAVPFAVALAGGESPLVQNTTLSPDGTATVVFQLAGLAPGRHPVSARITPPAEVDETDATNDEAGTVIEIFLGRFTHDGATYRIRAGANGQPESALDGNGTSYSLELDQAKGATLYRFQADGQDVTWDPLNPLSPPADQAVEGKKAPAPVGVLVMALLIALALLRRR